MEKDIILQLILEDIKHTQFIESLNAIGVQIDDRHIVNLDIVVALMLGYSKGNIPDEWMEMYHTCILTYNPESTSVIDVFNKLTLVRE